MLFPWSCWRWSCVAGSCWLQRHCVSSPTIPCTSNVQCTAFSGGRESALQFNGCRAGRLAVLNQVQAKKREGCYGVPRSTFESDCWGGWALPPLRTLLFTFPKTLNFKFLKQKLCKPFWTGQWKHSHVMYALWRGLSCTKFCNAGARSSIIFQTSDVEGWLNIFITGLSNQEWKWDAGEWIFLEARSNHLNNLKELIITPGTAGYGSLMLGPMKLGIVGLHYLTEVFRRFASSRMPDKDIWCRIARSLSPSNGL